MALISRIALACNKCGKEFYDAKANLNIMGEEFYLCDRCLDGLLDYISSKSLKTSMEEKKPTTSYTVWDDYNLGKLMDYMKQGLTQPAIADAFCVGRGAITSILYHIRNSVPGSNLYKWRKYLEEVDNGN